MNSNNKPTEGIKIFAGSSNHKLAKKITEALGIELSDMSTGQFADGESFVKINELVRGYDIFVIQSTSDPVNDNLMELLITIDALKRASAGRITAVIPYFAYARQDRKYSARDPISAKLVAELLEAAGVDRVVTMDLHSSQLQGFFNCALENMRGVPLFIEYYRRKIFETEGDFVVVSPSVGAVKRNRHLAEKLNIPLAIIDKRSDKGARIIGDVKGKNIIMLDDMIDTGNTICSAADALEEHGVAKVFVCGIHPILAGSADEMIRDSIIEELVILDTICHAHDRKTKDFKVLSVCDIFANAIISIHNNRSVSRFYNELHEVDNK